MNKKGLIKNVLPQQNIWAVSYKGFEGNYKDAFAKSAPEGGAENPSARKAAVMESILDQLNKSPLPANGIKTLAVSGAGTTLQHLWGFSDDDFGNYSKAKDVLQTGVDAGRWPHVKITLFFTGTNHPTEKPRSIVLRPKTEPRPFTEVDEWKKIIK